MEMGTWPQSGGPQGSLGETLKSWTNQAGLPLVSATWVQKEIQGKKTPPQEELWRWRVQYDTVPGMAHFSTSGRGSSLQH